jgi:tetratricopeptide (TPR) repeat protein
MPGHIYYLLGDRNTAHTAFLQADAADARAMEVFGVNFQNYWEYIHNIAYMTGNLGEAGRLSEALKWATVLQALEVNPNQPLLLDWDPVYNRPAARYYFQGLVALPLLHFQYADWAEAQTALTLIIKFLEPSIINSPTAWLLKYYDALRQYACVMEAYNSADLPTATTCFAQLQSQHSALDVFMNRSTENGFQVGARSYISLGVNVEEAEGVILAISHKWEAALIALAAANASEAKIPYNEPPVYTRPVLATYADVLQRMANATGDPLYLQEAVTIYGQILASPWHNNSGFGWFGVGYSYSLLKNVPAAKFAFKEFLSVWNTADPQLPQVVYAKLYLDEQGTQNKNETTTIQKGGENSQRGDRGVSLKRRK